MSNLDLRPKYEIGEKLLCFHGPLMYEAKCLDVKVNEDGVMYFVHYRGWNKNWDEWVTDKRMFKYNEEGLRKQKELERQIKSGKVKVLRKSDLKSQSLPPPEVLEDVERTLKPGEVKQEVDDPKTKNIKIDEETNRKTDARVPAEVKETEDIKPPIKCCEDSCASSIPPVTVTSRTRKSRVSSVLKSLENEDGLLSQPRLSMSLPPCLKSWLMDDCDLITRQARLYKLPASQPICNLLSDFLETSEAEMIRSESTCDDINNSTTSCTEPQNSQLSTNMPINPSVRREFVAGIQHFFNLTIGSHLLYKFERLQYAELLKRHTDKRMSDIYGSIHLLRLFVKLREMVSYVRVDIHSLPMLEALVAEFLQFLQQNESRYFRMEDYSVATAEYQRRAMC
uniref:Chromo domain-containing protein n=1 Tax=Trichobilharzia regenti TaxID=157069 RepID=A0AA85JKL8_TRIRE|nr:unnamed protein product [Trichobilharzia regenti]